MTKSHVTHLETGSTIKIYNEVLPSSHLLVSQEGLFAPPF